ncbi:CPBP family intramembrane glutamic endopeptidase [Catellatospora tritici]|uniref:CPBP family intramembrane glutamic endopeptidase n=1 Tax=Catellatospora tritici TaxID=2851566 RepID=UPI001C2DD7CB|nr:CPBP family intramembrane glutamic endopeptidase [Catellatospora tritici]MBV1850739.1 CPBP family intramembrane metalloprotease [Catellatospora tritici]MBV1850992.1 CPBP family intramembrane metalloprotease [Catellatospora tritici]
MRVLAEVLTHILLGLVASAAAVNAVRSVRRRGLLVQRLTADPSLRPKVYRRMIVLSWATAALVPLAVLVSPDLTAPDAGWTMPGGDGLDYALAALMMLALLSGTLGLRRRLRRGNGAPVPAGMTVLLPRDRHERLLAALVAVSAGVTEEVVFRGLLIGAVAEQYQLPVALTASASAVLFLAGHAYQGRRGLFGVAYLTVLFTALYLASGSILLGIAVHVCHDLAVFLLVPAQVSPKPRVEAPAVAQASAEAVPQASAEAVPQASGPSADEQLEPPAVPALRASAPGM